MKKITKVLGLFLFIITLLQFNGTSASAETLPLVTRLSGNSRIETAIAVSKEAYPNQADTVILAGFMGSADALTGTLLANEKNAPLLITSQSQLSPEVLKEIGRLGASKVYILGGASAVSMDVENALRSLNYNVIRLAGENRAETAVAIANEVFKNTSPTEAFVIENSALVDALSIGSVAAMKNAPIFLTGKDYVSAATEAALKNFKIEKITIIGGESTVSAMGKKALEKIAQTVDRVSGINRIETALAVANKYNLNTTNVIIADGHSLADALVGGYFATKTHGYILLIEKNQICVQVQEKIKKSLTKTYVLGGQSVINKIVEDNISLIMGGKEIPVLPKPETNGLEILTGVEREILTLVNQHRAANGLKPLAWDNTLGESARYKSAAMIQYNYFAHENPQLNGMSASSLIWEKYGAKFYTVGENIAARMGPKGTALQLFTQWKESDGHNKNMLNSRYTHMGVGVVYSPKAGSYFHNMATTSATQHFGG